jgi:glutaryl-CoA dehydrogenase
VDRKHYYFDIAIVWAKDELGNVRGIIVDTAYTTNYNSTLIEDKWSFRTSKTGELIFSESKIPKSQILSKTKSI